MDIKTYKQNIEAKKITCYDFVSDYVAKIMSNRHLNAVIELNKNALNDAKAIDEMNEKPGPLFGYPVLIKDNINSCDTTATGAGSISLAQNLVKEDAPIVKNLRKAGAVIIGKANMTEFANYMVDYREYQGMPNGYSSRGGQCIHPFNKAGDPGGSSTGSAVAVAAGIVPIALGTETYGSIILPSQRCGIVGIKPTATSVSTEGVIPISETLDIVGPMANNLEDAVTILGILQNKEYKINPKTNVRVGVYKNKSWIENQQEQDANSSLLEKMEALGMNIIQLNEEIIDESFIFEIMRYEFKNGINTYLNKYGNVEDIKNLSDIIKFNEKNEQEALKYGQNNLVAANEIGENWNNDPIYVDAISKRNLAINQLEDYFNKHNLDIVFMETAHCGLAAATGFPSITFPLGRTKEDIPMGCCLISKRDREDILINVAATLI